MSKLKEIEAAARLHRLAALAHRESQHAIGCGLNALSIRQARITPETLEQYERTRLALVEAEENLELLTRGY